MARILLSLHGQTHQLLPGKNEIKRVRGLRTENVARGRLLNI